MAAADRPLFPLPADPTGAQPTPPGGYLPPPIIDAEFSEAPRHLREHLWVLHKYRWLAATCFGLTFGLTVFATLLTPRLYTASTRLELARQSPIQLRLEGNVLRLDDGDPSANGAATFLSTQVAALQSRNLAERVIRSRGLADSEAFLDPGSRRRGRLSLSGTTLRLLRPRGLETAPAGPSEDGSAGRGSVDPALIDRYMRYLSVQEIRGTDLVAVRFTTPSPSLSAFLAAAHTQAYLEANEEARRADDVTAKEFLGRQLRESREHAERAEAALSRFAAEHPNVAINEEQKTVAQRISDVSSLLSKAEGTRLALHSRYDFLTRPDGDALAYFLDRPGIQKLHLAILDLRAQRAGLGQRLGPRHPQILELRRQEAEIELQLRAEVAQEVASVRSRNDAAQLREEELRRKLAHLGATAVELRDLGARYQLLKSDEENTYALHASLLKQQMETAVNSELAASNVRVVERAEVPLHASRPNMPLDLTLGVLAGLVLAVGAAFFCEYFDQSVKSRHEVEGLLRLPTLAVIPNFALARRATARALNARGLLAMADANGAAANGSGGENGAGGPSDLVVLREPWSRVAEAFRSFRTAVLFSVPEAPPKVILVTSTRAAEGKTVGSINLATALAQAGSRVLLLDADLRHPRCHRVLGVDAARGLSSCLAGEVALASVLQALDAPPLFFIPAGPLTVAPAELVGSVRMRQALAELRGQYDFVIVDTPPVLPVTDAVVLATMADAVVLVVKGHATPRELVRHARDRLAMAGARLLGVVVNNVDLAWGDLYFYDDYDRYDQPPQAEARA